MYNLLVLAFHFVDEIIKGLINGRDVTGTFPETRLDDLLARSVIVFCTFIPLFAFRQMRRVLGEDKFRALLFHDEAIHKSS